MALADNKAKIKTLLDKINALPDAGAGGSAIINVSTLPTTDIRDDVFYRVPMGAKFYYVGSDGGARESPVDTCEVVETLPETGNAATDAQLSAIYAYYALDTGTVSGYAPAELAAMFGLPAGWYPAEMLFGATGFNWGGVVFDTAEMTVSSAYYVLIQTTLKYRASGAWEDVSNIKIVVDLDKSTANVPFDVVREMDMGALQSAMSVVYNGIKYSVMGLRQESVQIGESEATVINFVFTDAEDPNFMMPIYSAHWAYIASGFEEIQFLSELIAVPKPEIEASLTSPLVLMAYRTDFHSPIITSWRFLSEGIENAIRNSIIDQLYLKSPSGKKFKVTVDDNGTLTATQV